MAVTVSWSTENFVFEFGVAIGIQKEFSRSNDLSIINEKHSISVRGQIIASGATPEERYENLILQTLSYAQKIAGGSTRSSTAQMGTLVISGDGGELLRYDDVALQSVDVSEPSDDTAGIQYQDVSLVFETYMTPSDPASVHKLRSASETLDIKKEEDSFAYLGNNIDTENSPYHAYTVTHTISAEGLINNKDSREAFEEAFNYVNEKKKDSLDVSNADPFQRSLFSTINQRTLAVSNNTSIVVDETQINQYGQYNKIRTASSDIFGGSYSITTTFFLSREESLIDITGNYNRDESGDASVSVEGTVRGLSSLNPTATQHDKIIQARKTYVNITGDLGPTSKIYKFAKDIFDRYQLNSTCLALRDKALNYSFGENKNAGTVVFNVSYKVVPTQLNVLLQGITGAMVATASISDNNRSGAGFDVQTVVIIPIIGRSAGPIKQDMNTTKERTRTAVIDVTIDPCYRSPDNSLLRSQALLSVSSYAPSGASVYINNFTENWEWTAGKYQGTLEWIYE